MSSPDRAGWRAPLRRWLREGLIDETTAAGIEAFEEARGSAAGSRLAVVLAWACGGVSVVAGVLLFVAAHWEQLSPGGRFGLVVLLTVAFHVAAALAAARSEALAAVLHAVGTASLGAAILLAGQIFHLQEHWPGALMLWALGAWAGWFLLRQWPQGALAAILTPWWLAGEWEVAVEPFVSDPRPWAAGLTLLAAVYLGARREAVARNLAAALTWVGGLAIIPCAAILAAGDALPSPGRGPIPNGLLAAGWIVALALPLVAARLLSGRLRVPHLVAAGLVVALATTYGDSVDPLAALWQWLGPYLLCAAASVGLVAWGLRDRRPERINLGVAGFAITVVVYYFSNVMDKLGRSISLLGLGALFLVLGWGLEKARRRLLAQIGARVPSGGAA